MGKPSLGSPCQNLTRVGFSLFFFSRLVGAVFRFCFLSGTALTDLKTKAVAGSTHFSITGQKRWMSGGGHSDMVLFARLSDAPGASGIGAIYVPQNTPGIQFGSPETLMGFRGIPSADISFDNVQVPKENLLVPPGSFGKLMSVFNLERCGNATMSFSQAQASLDVRHPLPPL